MFINRVLIVALILGVAIPTGAAEKHRKKKGAERGMLEKMEAVPCGAKQRGITGIGSIFASAGIEAVNSEEKLCPQYLLRTDEMEYHIRPKDKKHPVLLPVGEEGEFKIKKSLMYLKVPDGDHKKRPYQVVSMKPIEAGEGTAQGASYRAPEKPSSYRAPEQRAEKATGNLPNSNAPPPPQR
jgi:hypothetical protein